MVGCGGCAGESPLCLGHSGLPEGAAAVPGAVGTEPGLRLRHGHRDNRFGIDQTRGVGFSRWTESKAVKRKKDARKRHLIKYYCSIRGTRFTRVLLCFHM